MYNFYFIDSPVSDRFISPAPGHSNSMRMAKQISTNENRPYFSVTSRNNSVSLHNVTGPPKKFGTLGLFFRKVRYLINQHNLLNFSQLEKNFNNKRGLIVMNINLY